uniref:Scarecrow-like protein 6 n=1 Tax=Anthurium amnicola TaxID=1678845 RepID=A0A1D1XYN3_9ARAE
MRGTPSCLQGKEFLEVGAAAEEELWRIPGCIPTSGRSSVGVAKEGFEPRSVLDHGRSPSPPTSASTLSSPPDSHLQRWVPAQDTPSSALAEGAVVGSGWKEERASELQPIPAGLEIGFVGGDGCVFSDPEASSVGASLGQDQTLLRWVMGDVGDPSSSRDLKLDDPFRMLPRGTLDFEGFGLVDPVFGCEASGGMRSSASGSNHNPNFWPSTAESVPFPLPLPPGMEFKVAAMEEKPRFFGPSLLLDQQQLHPPKSSAFFVPSSPYPRLDQQQQQQLPLPLPPHPKRHHPMADHRCQIPYSVPFSDCGQELSLRGHQQSQLQQWPTKPTAGGDEATTAASQQWRQQQEQEQALVDQLFKAAELVEAGNFAHARVILARLNHQLSTVGEPLVRSAFYCKEALQFIISNDSNNTPPSTLLPWQRNHPSSVALPTPLDVVLKLSAYKAFSEISPILRFADFTCTQALLEELDGCNRIHILDFDIGVGGLWPSFMQELAQRCCAAMAATPFLKITALASLSSHDHPLELSLTGENLSHFAGGLDIPFEFSILNIDPFDPSSLLNISQSDEAIAVNLPVSLPYPSISDLLHLVKQLSPKILVSVDHGWNHSGLVFSHHLLHTLQSATILLDSIDAAATNRDVANKIERYLLQPRIKGAVLGHHHAAEKGLPWRTLFSSAGFASVPFSHFTETQAECLLERTQVRGFRLEKRQASLLLCWRHGVLVSVSAWKC